MSKDTTISGDGELTEPQYLAAGPFSPWLRQTRRALLTGDGVDVPCGECNACCRSSYFIHIKPTEKQTLTRINRKLLFPAPGMPTGNVVMGYDQHGHCPMLQNNACSIYQHRPQTCRHYDCRIFAAAGIAAGDADKAHINERVRRWQFSYPSQQDHAEHTAVQSAATFLRTHPACFPAGAIASNPTDLAILAITVYDVFLTQHDESSNSGHNASDAALANAVIQANAAFEARYGAPPS